MSSFSRILDLAWYASCRADLSQWEQRKTSIGNIAVGQERPGQHNSSKDSRSCALRVFGESISFPRKICFRLIRQAVKVGPQMLTRRPTEAAVDEFGCG